jgi:hypothetical protein
MWEYVILQLLPDYVREEPLTPQPRAVLLQELETNEVLNI